MAGKKKEKPVSPFANEAVCLHCRSYSQVRSKGFCCKTGRWRKLPEVATYSTKPMHCSSYYPKDYQHEGF